MTSFLGIKYWPTWIGIGVLWLIAYLPFYGRFHLGRALGLLSYYLARDRRYITHTNITLCFPELSPQAQTNLTRECFIQNGIGLIETSTGWVRDPKQFRSTLTLIGTEHMDRALSKGKGVLLLGAHYTTLDFSANLLSQHYPFGTTYRPHKNPLFDAFMFRGRLNYCNGVFDRKNIRGAFKHLRKGQILWYAPDQDYGPDHAVYAPFFGHQAATITAASRFADFNNSPVLLIRHHRRGSKQEYEMEFIPFPDSFPSNDHDDAVLINQHLEAAIKVCPEQYLWMHKRFKTQEKGAPASPYINIKTASSKASSDHYNQVIEHSRPEVQNKLYNEYQLESGAYIKAFPGCINHFTSKKHLAKKFDHLSKALRMKGIASVTTDYIYRVKDLNITAILYFKQTGPTIKEVALGQLPIKALAQLFSCLHQHGFRLNKIKLNDLILTQNEGISVVNPEDIEVFPCSLSYMDRCDNLLKLFKILQLELTMLNEFLFFYLEGRDIKEAKILRKMISLKGWAKT